VSTRTYHAKVYEGEMFYMQARLESNSGELLTRTHVSAATQKVFDVASTTPNTSVYTPTLVASADPPTGNNIVFASEQIDGSWPDTKKGYTFWRKHDPTDFALEGGRTYRFEFKITADSQSSQTFPKLGDYGEIVLVFMIEVKGTATD
jgi:hypothetical protein